MRFRSISLIVVVTLILDQLTKYLAVAHLTRVFKADGAATFGEKLASFAKSLQADVIVVGWRGQGVSSDR